MLGVLLLGVLEGVLVHGLEGHFLQEARGDDAIGVDVVAGQRDAAPRDLTAPLPPVEVAIARRRAHLAPTDVLGLMPHVTTGSMASMRATSSNVAPGSVAISTARGRRSVGSGWTKVQ